MDHRGLIVLLSAAAACATPSQADYDAHAAEAARLMRAEAVHMPPKGTDPCVGVTARLTEAKYADEREQLASRISDEEITAAIEAAGAARCREIYRGSLADAGAAFEPLAYRVGYGIDPAGKVCAIVERDRPEPIDPSADAAIDNAGTCLKNVLFAASFPTGRVEDRERVIRFYTLGVTETATSAR